MTAILFEHPDAERYSASTHPEYLPDVSEFSDGGEDREFPADAGLPDAFGVDDGDGDDFVALAVRDVMARELLRPDGFGHVGELWDRDDNGIEYQPRARPAKLVCEVCDVCAWPLNLPRPWRQCEFAGSPGLWWREDRPAWCHCSRCMTAPRRRTGRPESYCSDGCRWRMKLARERARRRAEGAASRSFDAEADARADYEIAIRQREAQRIASDHYPRW